MRESSIAVVGMSGIFPGATGAEAFWANICNRTCAVVDIPASRPDLWSEEVFNPSFAEDKTYSKRAALVLEQPVLPENLKLQSELMADLDPLHRWALYGAWNAISGTETNRYAHHRRGIILAAIALPTGGAAAVSGGLYDHEVRHILTLKPDPLVLPRAASLCGRVVSSPAALVARALELKGICYTLDAACASSLYAVKLACDELLAHRADVMLAGGASGADILYTQIGFSQLKALSPSGRCAPFDHKADGLVVGEGAGMVALKRLEDAIHDQDCIFGVIQGIGLSNDMRGNLLAPESAGQLRAMQAAYRQADWHPEDLQYIECHGAGTRVGDATELASLHALWQNRPFRQGQCAIGSVKSMVGHLLTGAGAAGLIKTLLALHHQTLPPSLNFDQPAVGSPLHDGPFKVQTRPEMWPEQKNGTPRRAAVSAFGFGGINAHVLIEEWPRSKASRTQHPSPVEIAETRHEEGSKKAATEVAVIGMDVCLGSLGSLSAFQHAFLNGNCALKASPARRWRLPHALGASIGQNLPMGAFIETIACAIGEFQIPPGEIPDILPQQLLMLKTAANALKDAGLPLREARETMGAVIGIAYDYEATNFHLRWRLPDYVRQWRKSGLPMPDASEPSSWLETVKAQMGPGLTATRTLGALGGIVASRIAREFRLGAPSFVVSAEEASGLRAVEIAMRLLQSGEADCMLAGAVDLFCDERNLATVFTRLPLSRKGRIRPFDENADGTLPGEGAVALVLKRLPDAVEAGDRIYGVIKGVGSAAGDQMAPRPPSAQSYGASLSRALESARVEPETIGLMEVHGSGVPDQDTVEAQALAECFKGDFQSGTPSIAVGTTKPLVGHTGAVSGLASTAKVLLSLHHRTLPPAIHFKTPRLAHWRQMPFHFPRQASPWIRNRADGPRRACVGAMTHDGSCMHLVLQQAPEPAGNKARTSIALETRPMGPLRQGLFLVRGSSKTDLLEQLKALETMAGRQGSGSGHGNDLELEHLARAWFAESLQHPPRSGLVLGILADTPESLRSLIAQACRAVEADTSVKLDRRGGLCYLPELSRQNAPLTFVYPGSGNHAIGMGGTLGAHWPGIMDGMDQETEHLRFHMLPHLYQPWRSNFSNGWEAEAYAALVADPLNTIFGQVVFGSQMTRLLARFNVRPSAVIGYSLGESTGFFATGAWPDREVMLRRLADSDLFKTRLTGPCLALKQAWGLNGEQVIHWRVAAVNRDTATVDKAIAEFPHLRRLIVNTPDECVIGGLQDQLQAAIKRMNCEAVYLDGVVTVHCDAARPVAQAYKELHLFPTTTPEGIRYYSCAWGKAYRLTSDKAAQSILDQALTGFDFTSTVRQAYEDGSRIFLEIGPHNSCTRMIHRILADQSSLAIAAHSRGENECFSLLKGLTTLAAAGVEVDLSPLYGYPEHHLLPKRQPQSKLIHVPVGGAPLALEPPKDLAPIVPTDTVEPIADTEDQPSSEQDEIGQGTVPKPVQTGFEELFQTFDQNVAETADAHEKFLTLSRDLSHQYAQTVALQSRLLQALGEDGQTAVPSPVRVAESELSILRKSPQPVTFSREQCMEFAIGSVGKMLGPDFDIIDTYPARVRLPDEPLMLVDRILLVEGKKMSLGPGRVVTEHDVLPGAWYLDGGRAPVCISVEAGQADLFLSGYLGIDHQVKGRRTYRLLDARIVFHRQLPEAGETIRYDIRIDKFVKQGQTYLFFFRFEGHIGDQHLITMTDGCAGFFTEEEVRNSGGILLTEADLAYAPIIDGQPFRSPIPVEKTTLADEAVEALRSGDAGACFGALYSGITLPRALRLPGGRMRLIDRVLDLDPQGGRFGLGYVRAEADIHPEDWFLTCHFVDDMVMPGTLMYECCAHTLRVLLLRLGWVTDLEKVCYEPVRGVACRLKCRGPVTPSTRHVHYAVEIKEIGYQPEPYVIADAHMYADGRYIVFFQDMSMQLSGATRREIEDFWQARAGRPQALTGNRQAPEKAPESLFTRDHILAFAVGRPSVAFGEPYAVFDGQRTIARLPGPPYCFMDRITHIEPEPWVLKPGGWVEAQYDVPAHAWYFGADRSGEMPFCVLLEIALQPCGWLAAYLGSALKSRADLKFRNLGGEAVQHAGLVPQNKTLTMRTRLTKLSDAADMIIEHFDFEVLDGRDPVYTGNTYFGFFTAKALSQQVGLREAVYSPTDNELAGFSGLDLEDAPPLTPDDPVVANQAFTAMLLPARALRMIDRIEAFCPDGGPHGLGFIRGTKQVDPGEWFFKAHFYQDPVCPGSLGVESFLQLIKFFALQRWPALRQTHRFQLLQGVRQRWSYRGQVIPSNRLVVVDAVITQVEDGPEPVVKADGWLHVDGLSIYKMEGFGYRLVRDV